MNLALKMFIEEKGREVLEKNLYRNFVLHVCNLFEFGVLGPGHVFTAITRMQKFATDRSHRFISWQQHRTHWELHAPESLSPNKEKTRKDFSGIFKNSDNINPYVVLSPLAIQHRSVSDTDDNMEENENKNAAGDNNGAKHPSCSAPGTAAAGEATVKQEEELEEGS